MNRLILGAERQSIKALFRQSRYQIVEFDLLPSNEPLAPDADQLIVFEAAVFDALCDCDIQRLEGCMILLLVSGNVLYADGNKLKSDKIRVFYLDENSGTSTLNLNFLIDSLFEKIILSHRLNSYIKDSFSDIVDSSLLQKQKKEIEELNEKLREISRVDYLTNLLNRRALLESFEMEKRRALRCRWRLQNFTVPGDGSAQTAAKTEFVHQASGKLDDHVGNFSCLMIDIDHFKKVNDTYGHLVGDVVLKRFGELLRQKGLFRDTDVLGRYGGEEFIVLLPETNSAHALIPAQRLRQSIGDILFEDSRNQTFSVTVSIGVSEFLPEEVSSEEMIKRADEALYYAKEHGRNQVCLYDSVTKTIVQTS